MLFPKPDNARPTGPADQEYAVAAYLKKDLHFRRRPVSAGIPQIYFYVYFLRVGLCSCDFKRSFYLFYLFARHRLSNALVLLRWEAPRQIPEKNQTLLLY